MDGITLQGRFKVAIDVLALVDRQEELAGSKEKTKGLRFRCEGGEGRGLGILMLVNQFVFGRIFH